MSRKAKIFIGIILFGIIIYKAITIQFYDKEFERAVRECMSMSGNGISMRYKKETGYKGVLLRSDINKVETIYIDINKYKIRDLRDLKHFKSLCELDISYVPKENDAATIDMPAHIDTIFNLQHLNRLTLFKLNINESYSQIDEGVKTLILDHNRIADYDFIKSFPNVDFLTLADEDVGSLEFIKDLQHLRTLQLSDNSYTCPLEPLALAGNLTELNIFSDTPEVFEQLPLIPSVKELHLEGKAVLSHAQAERYIKWDNLEKLWLGGDMYDVAMGTWSTEN